MPKHFPIQPIYKFNKNKLAASIIIASTLGISHTTSAARISIETEGGISSIAEGNTLSIFVDVLLNGFASEASCNVSGTISVIIPNPDSDLAREANFARENSDFRLLDTTFSVDVPVEDSAISEPIDIEILNDTNDNEGPEQFSLRVTDVNFGDCSYYGEDFSNSETPNEGDIVFGYYETNDRTFIIQDVDAESVEETPSTPANTLTLNTKSQQVLRSPSNLSIQATKLQTQNLSNQLRRLRNGLRGNDLTALSIQIADETIAGNNVKRLFGAGAGDGNIVSQWGTFVGGAIQIGQEEADSESLDFNVNSLFLGADYRANSNVILGGALGYVDSTTDIQNSESETTMNGLSLAAFASYYYKENYYIDGILSYGLSDYELQRELNNSSTGVAKGETEGSELSLALNTGYYFRYNEQFIQLYSSLNWVTADIEGYQENLQTGSPAGDIYRVDDHTKESLTTSLGIEYGRAFNTSTGVVTPQIFLDWEKQYKDDANAISGRIVGSSNTFSVDNTDQDKDYFNFGLGLSAVFAGGISAYANYEVDLERENFDVYDVSLGVRWEL